jgi:hypothetical protein
MVLQCDAKNGAAMRCIRLTAHKMRGQEKTGWKTERLQPALVNVQLHRIKKQAGKSDLFFLKF